MIVSASRTTAERNASPPPLLPALTSCNPTVQVALNDLGQGYVPDQAVIMAGTLVGTLPVIVVFALLGRHIVGGIMAGAVKG